MKKQTHLSDRLGCQKVKSRLEIYFLILQIFWLVLVIVELFRA